MKEELCNAFCEDLTVREVGAGLAVSTAFDGADGDPIGFFIVGPDEKGLYRIEDDGAIVPFLEASGASLDIQTRYDVFNEVLDIYGASYDDESGELVTSWISEQEVAPTALRFVALLLRVQDILFLAHERAVSTFREEALQALSESLGSRAVLSENEPVSEALKDVPADVLIRATGRDPVALFWGTSDQKVTEAIVLQLEAAYHHNIACSVVALIEHGKSVSQKTLQRATNRLSATPIYRGDEKQSILKVQEQVLGRQELH